MEIYEFNKIFDLKNRANWKEMIEPHITEIDVNERMTKLDDEWYSFLPEELDPDFKWKFNLGDIVTDGSKILKIVHLPTLDQRSEYDFDPNHIDETGNRYFCIALNENGEELDKDNPYGYLHQKYTENQIHLV